MQIREIFLVVLSMLRFYLLVFNGLILIEIFLGVCQAQQPDISTPVLPVPRSDPNPDPSSFGNLEVFSIPSTPLEFGFPQNKEIFSRLSTTRIHGIGFGEKIHNSFFERCIGGIFFYTGRGGKPLNPSDLGTLFVWEDLRSPISSQFDIQIKPLKSIELSQLEAQGLTEDKNGQIILSSQPNRTNPIAITNASVPCHSLLKPS